MKSIMGPSHNFSQVPHADVQRSKFDRSHGYKTTFDSGKLIPFFVDEALPGDTFNLRTDGFARMSTPLYPAMDNVFMETFYFAVPIRLIWDNFQKMMGEQENPGDSVDFLVPQITTGPGIETGSLFDYMGIPTKVPGLDFSALWPRAYNLIWNEWFRDQNLQNSVPVHKGDGPDPRSDYTVLNRNKRHDYFTSSLPWPQKGETVDIPLGLRANIVPEGGLDGTYWFESLKDGSGDKVGAIPVGTNEDPKNAEWAWFEGEPTVSTDHLIDWKGFADLSTATSATINQLRQAFQVQKMYERDARGGSRYTEIVRSHFKVTSPDARLQRPEYLGGGHSPIHISPIASNTLTSETPLGQLGAIGTSSFQGHGFTKSFTEHTIIIGLVNVRADITYQQGLNRMWSRRDRLDFYWPALAHIGEQEVLNKEIFAQGSPAGEVDDEVFGYQERYAEYRYKPSIVTGKFRSNDDQSLDAWHLADDYEWLPTLSDAWIRDQPAIARILAVQDEPQFIADFHHNLMCARPMPMFGVPGNIDRF